MSTPIDQFDASFGKVKRARSALAVAERELAQLVDELHAKLAGAIRQVMPEVTVWLDRRGTLQIKYGTRGRTLQLKYDTQGARWITGSTPFDRQFEKYYRTDLNTSNIEIIAKAVSRYFTSTYPSLGK